MVKRKAKGKKSNGVAKRKASRRDAITSQILKAVQKQDDARRRIEEKEARKKELEGGEQTEEVKAELMDIDNQIAEDNETIKNAKVEEEKLQKEEKDIKMRDAGEDKEDGEGTGDEKRERESDVEPGEGLRTPVYNGELSIESLQDRLDKANDELVGMKSLRNDLETRKPKTSMIQTEIKEMNSQIGALMYDIELLLAKKQELLGEEPPRPPLTGMPPGRPNPKATEPSEETAQFLSALLNNLQLGQPKSGLEVSDRVGLSKSETLVTFKPRMGSGKIGIVCDVEIEDAPIFRLRTDIVIDNVPNLMTYRRAGVVNEQTQKKWAVADIYDIRGIAINVPVGYLGNAEDLVRRIPQLSGTEKDKLKAQNKPIPQQPDVQLLLEWKKSFKGYWLSWESRSGCNTLWKKRKLVDRILFEAAKYWESKYRELGGGLKLNEPGVGGPTVPRGGLGAGLGVGLGAGLGTGLGTGLGVGLGAAVKPEPDVGPPNHPTHIARHQH